MTSYSFIKPQKKPILNLFNKIWIFLIISVVLIFAAVNFAIAFKNQTLRNETQMLKQNIEQTKQRINQADELAELLKRAFKAKRAKSTRLSSSKYNFRRNFYGRKFARRKRNYA